MFATAAAAQLKGTKSMLDSGYFSALLIYLSIIFVPEAIWLTWSFPHWESMHVYSSLTDIPTPVVVTFILLDFLIAMIGFWVAYKCITAGRDYLAHVQWFCWLHSILLHPDEWLGLPRMAKIQLGSNSHWISVGTRKDHALGLCQ